MSFTVRDLFEESEHALQLSVEAGENGMKRAIRVPEVQRPGLSLAGYLKNQASGRILLIGKVEIEYLRDLAPEIRRTRLLALLQANVPAVFVTRKHRPPKELYELCDQLKVPLIRTPIATMQLLTKLTILLHHHFAPRLTMHATLVEVFGIGVLVQGDSAVGKSEAALGLIERGHRLISDDTVYISKKEGSWLEGTGPELTRHLIEIRGIGILNVAHLYGVVCVCDTKRIDLVARLEQWDERHAYDRVGEEVLHDEILGINVPKHILPVRPGRDVVLLLETIALNHRLREMGYNSAKELNQKLAEHIAGKQRRKNLAGASKGSMWES